MGYVPPFIPAGVSHQLQEIYRAYNSLPDFRVHSDTPYRRYLRDLYGEPRRDWLPLLNATAIGCLAALVLIVAWLLPGW